MNAYAMRNSLELRNYNTTITRAEFEAHFTKTRESIRFTFNGWDGKSYDGESRNARVYRTNLPGYEAVRLIKVGKGLHYSQLAGGHRESIKKEDKTMTKQELIKMTGSEEQAAYAMEILLKNCKKPFVEMAIRAELKEIENRIKAFEADGIIVKCNGSYSVNWAKAYKPYGDEPGSYWHATKEQKAEAEAIEKRCYEANALLYTRNRTISLIAVRV